MKEAVTKEEYLKTLDMGKFPQEVGLFFTDESSPSVVRPSDLQNDDLYSFYDDTPTKLILREVFGEELAKLENKAKLSPEKIARLIKLRIDADWANEEYKRCIETPEGRAQLARLEQEKEKYPEIREPHIDDSFGRFGIVYTNRRYALMHLRDGIAQYIYNIKPDDSDIKVSTSDPMLIINANTSPPFSL